MSMLDDLLNEANARVRRLPRAKRIAAAMLDNPALLHEVVYRQSRSLWAGHLWALTFWTDTLSAYVDLWHERHDYFEAQGTPAFDQVTLAYARATITPEREIPRFMRQRPGTFYLRLPRENVFPRLKAAPSADIPPHEWPWLYFYFAEQSARGYFPPEKAWPVAIAEAGYWTALMLKTRNTDETARLLGMSGMHFRAAIAKARRLAEWPDAENVKRVKDEFLRRHESRRTRNQPERIFPEGAPF
ncbi:MAG: hypothetical protein HXY22_01930 [Alphaproteobacteria bacterium]|nr:hypothetical protein [Alphaproteobacteria bacterium]